MNHRTKNIFILTIGTVLFITALVTLFLMPGRNDIVCGKINVNVSDYDKYQFISDKEVENILQQYGDLPTGKNINDINLINIENEIEKHPMIKKATCYQSPNGDINIDVTQRVPLFRVFSSSGNYYVDNQRAKMPVSAKSSAYVPIVTGTVDTDFALNELYDFIVFIQNDNFLNSLIEQIYIYPDKKMELIPRIGNFTIGFGNIERYRSKLEKLKVFYDKVPQRVGWNTYSRINLEFKDQVVCTKR